MERPGWTDYFFEIARVVSSRATCPRARVGAVIVSQENRILATGYNGSPAGRRHCGDTCSLDKGGHCRLAIHAEMNAIGYAAAYGVGVRCGTMYIYFKRLLTRNYPWTAGGWSMDLYPCLKCRPLIVAAGIKDVWVLEDGGTTSLYHVQ